METEQEQESHLQINRCVEIVGKVTNDLSIRVLATTDFGTDIGMFGCANSYNPLLDLCVDASESIKGCIYRRLIMAKHRLRVTDWKVGTR